MKTFFRWLLAVLMVAAGVSHFVSPEIFIRIVPAYLPYPEALVSLSGFFEILGGVGLLIPRLRYVAAWGLVALYLAVFPANVNMAIHQIPLGDTAPAVWMYWARLPLQLLLILWAYWLRR